VITMSWEDILCSKPKEEYAHASVGATNPNDRTYTKEELKDLDDVVVSNGDTARQYAQGFGKVIVPDIFNMMHEKEYDMLTWVTNDVRKVAFESVMEELKDAMRKYFNIE